MEAVRGKSSYLVWLVRRAWNTLGAISAVSNRANTYPTRLPPHLGTQSFTVCLETSDTVLKRNDSNASWGDQANSLLAWSLLL